MNTSKTCFKCNEEKPISEFYKHPQMSDGHLGKCKDCAKRDARKNYAARRDQYSQYEQERNQRPERRVAKIEYQRNRRIRYPEKAKAWHAVSNAIRDGRLIRQSCKHCGDPNAQAHHSDYAKPLDVEWLCFKHHREVEHGQVVVTT